MADLVECSDIGVPTVEGKLFESKNLKLRGGFFAVRRGKEKIMNVDGISSSIYATARKKLGVQIVL